ncbi:MAG TPA: glycosyltransferase, partial [Kofleriaceae bacterium]|nr:glycosyltransferase [Kofleriaceae bacterium]
MAEPLLDIVIPVYNEGANIGPVLRSLAAHVKTPFRVLICYDRDDDDTLPALAPAEAAGMRIVRVKNRGRGAFGAVVTGFADSQAPAVLVFPADDDYNAPRLDAMVAKFEEGCDIVCASRFIPGGKMVGCPPLKAATVRGSAFVLHHVARLPTHDPSNGFRLFSRKVLQALVLESTEGFTYSIEMLVKAHRLGWRIGEVPVEWHERKAGKSRFQVVKWLPAYFVWFAYA